MYMKIDKEVFDYEDKESTAGDESFVKTEP